MSSSTVVDKNPRGRISGTQKETQPNHTQLYVRLLFSDPLPFHNTSRRADPAKIFNDSDSCLHGGPRHVGGLFLLTRKESLR